MRQPNALLVLIMSAFFSGISVLGQTAEHPSQQMSHKSKFVLLISAEYDPETSEWQYVREVDQADEAPELYLSKGSATDAPMMPDIWLMARNCSAQGTLTVQYGVHKDPTNWNGHLDILGPSDVSDTGLFTAGNEPDGEFLCRGEARNGAVIRSIYGTDRGAIAEYSQAEDVNAMTTIQFGIFGQNPDHADVVGYTSGLNLEKDDINWAPYFAGILSWESGRAQFNLVQGLHGEPNWGPPLGWGLTQRDFKQQKFPDGQFPAGLVNLDEEQSAILWNWQANIIAGKEILFGMSVIARNREKYFRDTYNLRELTKYERIQCAAVLYNGPAGLPEVDGRFLSYVPVQIDGTWEWSNFNDNTVNDGYWGRVSGHIQWEDVPTDERPPAD